MKKQTLHLNEPALLLRSALMFLFFCLSLQLQATVRYVKQSGSGDGSSWANASANLQAMINNSGAGDQVWVAANEVLWYSSSGSGWAYMGTYRPTTCTTCTPADRSISFSMKNGVAIYGGFPNTGNPGMGDRNWVTNVTTLSGDIGVPGDGTSGDFTDNSYHVISNNGLDNTAILDGFTVTGGNANGGYLNSSGAGMLNINASPGVANCNFSWNSASQYGGGMYNFFSSPSVANCSFFGNSVGYGGGGGMFNTNSSAVLTNCTFSGNSVVYGGGGGMYNNNFPSPTLTNCSFFGNSVGYGDGGGMFNDNSSAVVTNCTFSGNTVGYGYIGGMYNNSSSPTVTNCIFWGNVSEIIDNNSTTTVKNSIVQGGYSPCNNCPNGNGDANPLFISTSNLHLQACSPAINAGTATGAPSTDYDGNARPQGTGYDIGFDEYTGVPCCPAGNILYVKAGATGANNGTSWANAFTSLQSALASTCPGITQIWVAAGTYKPTSSNDRTISFSMKNGVAIYGGFIGTENSLSQRNWMSNVTTLSGDIGTVGNNTDNSAHVVLGTGANATAVLDGFTITKGNTAGAGVEGGGMYNGDNSSPTVVNCIFSENNATYGGAVYVRNNCFPSFTNCVFQTNTADLGGAILTESASTTSLTNCTFSGNTANSATINNQNSGSATIKNCIIWGNTGSTIVGNSNTTYSIIQGGYGGTGNLNLDPLFVSATNLRLQACSPAIDAGTATGAPATDYDGNARPQGAGYDIGFDEYTGAPCCPAGNILYVKASATGANNGTSWTHAFTSLQSALASTCPGITQIWVAAGTYKPGTARTDAFVMKNGVAIYGGFPNSGNPGFGNRNWVTNVTTLSGDIGTVGYYADNSAHVVLGTGTNATAVLDGFTITKGNTAGAGVEGGGMYNGDNSSPTVVNCIFSENNAAYGGAVYVRNNCFPSFTNCVFQTNTADRGGAILTESSSTTSLTNCTFSGNTANFATIRNENSGSATIKNCIIWGNPGGTIQGNSNTTYSIVQGGYPGMGNLNLNPLFVSATNLRLQACSPAIDAGIASGAPATDLDGNARPVNAAPNLAGNFDMGAYEFIGSTTAPVATCQPITVQLDANHVVIVTGSQVNSGSSGCGTLSFLLNGQASLSFDCDDLGTPQSVTLTVTDYFANTATCPATITVADDANPCCAPADAVCQNATIYLDGNGEAALSVSDVNGGSTYECGLDEMTVSPSAFNCSHVGAPQTVTLTVTDNNGESDNCTAIVTVEDNVAPTAACQGNVTVQLDENGLGSLSASMLDNGSSDACGSLGFAVVTAALPPPPPSGPAPPPSATPASPASGGGAAPAPPAPGTPPPPTPPSGSQQAVNYDCGFVGEHPYTLVVTDDNGNFNTCTGTITVEDNILPTALCHDITVQLDEYGEATITPEDVDGDGEVTSYDNCGIASLGLDVASFTCASVGQENTVELTVTDVNDNENTCTATVTVQDNAPPSVVCKSHTATLNANGQASIAPADVFDSGTDNCGTVNLQSVSPNSFTCSNLGSGNTVTLTVNDGQGNTNTCMATVTVNDVTAPSVTCQNISVDLNGSGTASIVPADVFDSGSDNCGTVNLQSVSPSSFTCENLGSGNIVTLTVNDGHGNTNTCEATITVQDNTQPSAVCKSHTVALSASGTASIAPIDVYQSGTDNCGTVNLQSVSPNSFTCENLGSGNTVTLTVNDGNGNENNCEATVTVQDNTQPSAVCKSHTATLNANGQATIAPADVFDSGSDNCGTVNPVSVSPSSFTCENLGSGNIVTLTVNDGNGNENTCEATVTVQDNTAPIITCPAPITVNNDEGECSAEVTYTVSGSDNCDFLLSQTGGLASGQPFPAGVTTNTWSVTDAANNSATCSFTVTVNKTGDPGLLWAYTVIGFDEVKMKANTVQSGGVGVVNTGKKAKLEQGTLVTAGNTFVKAPDLDLNGGSQVTTYYSGQVAMSLIPAFQPYTGTCNNNLNIPDNSAPVTLNLACYKDITVGKNVSVTFSGHATVNARDLKLKEGSSVSFAQNTNLLIQKKLDSDKYVTISNNGNMVWIFVDDHVKIDDGNSITANIYCLKHIHVDKTPAGNPTYMNGLFIAEKIDSKDNVFWNWDANICPYTPPLLLGAPTGNLGLAATLEDVQVQLQWVTNMNGGMEVERSTDGLAFSTLLRRENDLGTSAAKLFHDFDPNPAEGVNYYRVKQLQPDGSLVYSPVRQVAFNPGSDFTLFPNPSSGRVSVYMERFLGKEVDVVVSNNLGQELYRQHIPEVTDKLLRLDLDRSRFGEGLYSVSIVHLGRAQLKRLVLLRAD